MICCVICGVEPEKPRKCGKCKGPVYCGQDCQKVHWKTHKLICAPPAPPKSTGSTSSPANATAATLAQSPIASLNPPASEEELVTVKRVLKIGSGSGEPMVQRADALAKGLDTSRKIEIAEALGLWDMLKNLALEDIEKFEERRVHGLVVSLFVTATCCILRSNEAKAAGGAGFESLDGSLCPKIMAAGVWPLWITLTSELFIMGSTLELEGREKDAQAFTQLAVTSLRTLSFAVVWEKAAKIILKEHINNRQEIEAFETLLRTEAPGRVKRGNIEGLASQVAAILHVYSKRLNMRKGELVGVLRIDQSKDRLLVFEYNSVLFAEKMIETKRNLKPEEAEELLQKSMKILQEKLSLEGKKV